MTPRQWQGDPTATALHLIRILNVVTLACGIWLLVAPFAVGQETDIGRAAGFWNEIVVGSAVVAASVARLLAPLTTSPFALLLAALAVWLLVAPFALGYRTQKGWPPLMTGDVLTGVVLLVVSLGAWSVGVWMAVRRRSDHHPHRASEIRE